MYVHLVRCFERLDVDTLVLGDPSDLKFFVIRISEENNFKVVYGNNENNGFEITLCELFNEFRKQIL